MHDDHVRADLDEEPVTLDELAQVFFHLGVSGPRS